MCTARYWTKNAAVCVPRVLAWSSLMCAAVVCTSHVTVSSAHRCTSFSTTTSLRRAQRTQCTRLRFSAASSVSRTGLTKPSGSLSTSAMSLKENDSNAFMRSAQHNCVYTCVMLMMLLSYVAFSSFLLYLPLSKTQQFLFRIKMPQLGFSSDEFSAAALLFFAEVLSFPFSSPLA
jgi:hypothetical protein